MTGRLWRTSMAAVWLLASALEPVRAEEPPRPRPTSGFPASGIAANAIRLGGVTGRTGAILFDLHTGKVLDEVAADEAFPPASTIKIATVARALEILGPRYRFETRLLTNGKIIGSVLEGDLYLQGTGDPTLDTVDLADMLRQFRLMGVSEVRGQFLYDDSLLPRGSGIDDQQQDHVISNPGYGGLNLNFNRVWLDGFHSGEGFDARMLARADGRTVETDSIRLRYLPDVNFPLLRHRFEGREEIWEADFRTLAAVPKTVAARARPRSLCGFGIPEAGRRHQHPVAGSPAHARAGGSHRAGPPSKPDSGPPCRAGASLFQQSCRGAVGSGHSGG